MEKRYLLSEGEIKVLRDAIHKARLDLNAASRYVSLELVEDINDTLLVLTAAKKILT